MRKTLVLCLCAVFPLWAVRNVILMVADGWGGSQILAADYYLYGQAGKAPYESLAVSMYMSTYPAGTSPYDPRAASADATYVLLRPTDSAASATALACGVKTYNGWLGIDTMGLEVLNMAELAQKKGKAAGVASTVPFTHATPAAMAYHGLDRQDYSQITRGMLSSTLEVMLGEQGEAYYTGGALWASLRAGTCQGPEGLWTWSSTASSLDSLGKGLGRVPERLVGVYKNPRLSQLAPAALNVLEAQGQGFYLLLEGGKVDWAGHANSTDSLLAAMKDFNEASSAVIEWIGAHGGWEHNLLVVTGDHETGMLSKPENRGRGVKPGLSWGTTGHTNQLVPLFAQGAGANHIASALTGWDSQHGPYTDNALVGAFLQQELGKNESCQREDAKKIRLKLERDRVLLLEGREGFYEVRLFDSRGSLWLSLGREWRPAEGLEWKLPSFKGLALVVVEGPGGRWEQAVVRQ